MVNWGGGGDGRVIWGHLLQGVAQDVHGGGGGGDYVPLVG